MSEETFIGHEPCPDCGSKNNLGVYKDHTYCFGCEQWTANKELRKLKAKNDKKIIKQGMIKGKCKPLKSRGITLETCKKFSYKVGTYTGNLGGKHYKKSFCHIAELKDDAGNLIAQKLRLKKKEFGKLGKSKNLPLFGQHLWNPGGKMIVITEGEIDAMSVSQVQDNKWPVVSLPNGTGTAKKAIKTNLEYLESFEKVILMFDNDKAGRKCAQEVAKIFSPGKVKIASLPLNDPNEMLLEGMKKDIISAIWNAKSFRPDGIISGTDTWELLEDEKDYYTIKYPWDELNEITHGYRTAEIVMWTAGTGIGKSQVCRQVAWDAIKKEEKVAYIGLEETVKRSIHGLLSLEMECPLHLKEEVDKRGITKENIHEAWERVIGNGSTYFYDHWGSADSDNLINKIRYLAKGCDVKVVILDHISILISDIEGGDERRILDNMMTKLSKLVIELDISLHIVSHLRKTSGGKSFEEGGQITLDDLRGSGSLKQLSWTIIAIERDQQNAEGDENKATFRVLKNRTIGKTGQAGSVWYNADTTLLSPCPPVREDEDDDDDETEDDDEDII